MKKFCSCGKPFFSDTSESKCKSCVIFREYRCKHPQTEKRYIEILPELRFNLRPTWSNSIIEKYDKVSVLGTHSRDLKNTNHHVMHINLYKFDISQLQELIETINHEYIHFILYHMGEIEASLKYDTIARKLETWLC